MLLDYTQNGIHAIFEVTDGGLVILKQLSAGELAHTGSKASAHGNCRVIYAAYRSSKALDTSDCREGIVTEFDIAQYGLSLGKQCECECSLCITF